MARAPAPRIEQAKERNLACEKLTEIARLLGLPEGMVRRWKCTYRWKETDNERSHRNGDKESERLYRNEPKPLHGKQRFADKRQSEHMYIENARNLEISRPGTYLYKADDGNRTRLLSLGS